MLEIHQIKKSYSTGFELLIKSLRLENGIHLVKGENGSGKSTLLKAIAGIHPFEGDITLNGISLKKNPIPYRRQVSYSEAEVSFPDFLNLEELIGFVKETRKVDPAQISYLKKVMEVEDYSKNPLSSYSSGMLKKAGLILAFLGNPQLIILDEPFTTIDLLTQDRLQKLVLEGVASGQSFLITSHLANFERRFSYQNVLEISNGKMIASNV